jgi:hypothetical protein
MDPRAADSSILGNFVSFFFFIFFVFVLYFVLLQSRLRAVGRGMGRRCCGT